MKPGVTPQHELIAKREELERKKQELLRRRSEAAAKLDQASVNAAGQIVRKNKIG